MRTSIRGLFAATLFASTALAATPAFAQDQTDPPSEFTFTGGATLVTDYRFRGLSLSGGDPAIQGTIGVSHSSGFYVGVWASSLEQDPLDIYGNMELDVYGGWSGEIGSGLSADVGLLYYVYPGGSNPFIPANYFEPYASLSYDIGPATAKLGLAYAWKQDSLGGDDNLYVYFDLSSGIPGTPISVDAHVGYTDGALSPNLLTGRSLKGGWDYSVGASFAVTENISIGAKYVGVDGNSIDGYSNDTVVGSLSISF
jgi:uncharacterized protein (TIGR02001 family)